MPEARPGAGRISADIDRLGRHRRRAVRDRLRSLLTALEGPPGDGDGADRGGRDDGDGIEAAAPTRSLVDAVERALADPDASSMWLLIAVLTGELPDRAEVMATLRQGRLDGGLAALARHLPRLRPGWPVVRGEWPPVRVVSGEVVVDVHHTADTGLATGIQRVSRMTAQRWARDHDIRLARWTPHFTALIELDPLERERALHGTPAPSRPTDGRTVLVPWRCTYILPELMTEPRRARALEALLAFSRSRTGMIGFDCVPISSAETTGEGMGGGFASMLGAAAQLDRIATISQAARGEYSGWRTMLAGAGLPGPDVRAIPLALEAEPASPQALGRAREQLTVAGLPMVLVVGSHEPRKNHLAVLHAMELLWREGLQFSLVFVGGNAWRSERFAARLQELQGVGRPVETHAGMSDDLLWGAYGVAHLVLFPSLNEGFGLPVVEALSSGTPVVTSGYGSMLEIAHEGGALFVDPRDDADIAGAVRRLLTDAGLHADLARQARQRPSRSWDTYAAETWDYFTSPRPERAVPGPAPAGVSAG